MSRRLATIAIAVAACIAGLVTLGTPGETFGTPTVAPTAAPHIAGIFVSLGTDQAGTIITIDGGAANRGPMF